MYIHACTFIYKLLLTVFHRLQYQYLILFCFQMIFFPPKYRYPICDNIWLKDVLFIVISLEEILSGQKRESQTTHQIITGRGQCNICPVYFLLFFWIHEQHCSIPRVAQTYNCSYELNLLYSFFFFFQLILWQIFFSYCKSNLFEVVGCLFFVWLVGWFFLALLRMNEMDRNCPY